LTLLGLGLRWEVELDYCKGQLMGQVGLGRNFRKGSRVLQSAGTQFGVDIAIDALQSLVLTPSRGGLLSSSKFLSNREADQL
jgi:hypothetical protein